jgi:hypothetical protein
VKGYLQSMLQLGWLAAYTVSTVVDVCLVCPGFHHQHQNKNLCADLKATWKHLFVQKDALLNSGFHHSLLSFLLILSFLHSLPPSFSPSVFAIKRKF